MLGLQVLEIELPDKKVVSINHYLTDAHNVLLKENDTAIICVDAPKNAAPYYTVYQYDRGAGIITLIAVFFALMVLVGRRKGFDAFLALVFSAVFLVCVGLPLLYNGYSPVAVGFLTVLLLTAVTLVLLYGFTKECILGITVTLIGELAACE